MPRRDGRIRNICWAADRPRTVAVACGVKSEMKLTNNNMDARSPLIVYQYQLVLRS